MICAPTEFSKTHSMPFFRGRLAAVGPIITLAMVTGCSYVPRIVTEYRIDVQQGNVVTQEMASQLKPGLTRDQVKFVLGTPLLSDVFHAERWDYVYRLEKGRSGDVEQQRLSVFFDKNERLERVAGDVVAAATDSTGLATPEAKTRVIDLGSIPEGATVPPPEEKGLFRRLMETIGL